MRSKLPFIAALCLLPLAISAAPANLALTPETAWYVHADLLEMRQTPSGQMLYGWLEREVIEDVEQEFGINLRDELDGVTVFGSGENEEPAVVLHGFISAATRDVVLARASEEARVTTENAFGRTYYRIDEPGRNDPAEAKQIAQHHGDGAWLAFGDTGQTLVTTNRALLETFLAGDAHFTTTVPDGLLVIQAERAMLQGGLDAGAAKLEGGPWESQMFQNVRQIGLVVADDNGLMSVRADVVAVTPEMAQAVANIIQGIVSLKAVADEEPEAAELLSRVKTETVGDRVTMSLLVEPEKLVRFLD